MSNTTPLNRGSKFTRKQAAKYLGVTEGTLSVWATTGRYHLPYFKAGRLVYYFESDLNTFIDKRMVGGDAS